MPSADPSKHWPALPARHRKILAHIAQGASDAQIGRAIGCTKVAVSSMVSRILRGLGAANRAHAVVLAHRAGLLDLGCPHREQGCPNRPGFCKRGHRRTKQNTYIRRNGYADCRDCRRDRTRRGAGVPTATERRAA